MPRSKFWMNPFTIKDVLTSWDLWHFTIHALWGFLSESCLDATWQKLLMANFSYWWCKGIVSPISSIHKPCFAWHFWQISVIRWRAVHCSWSWADFPIMSTRGCYCLVCFTKDTGHLPGTSLLKEQHEGHVSYDLNQGLHMQKTNLTLCNSCKGFISPEKTILSCFLFLSPSETDTWSQTHTHLHIDSRSQWSA